MGRERNNIGVGLVLITVGGIFLLDRQGYGGFGHFWPLLLIVGGASKILFPSDSDDKRCRDSRSSGVWLLLVGVIFLLHQNSIWRISDTWPLFIVAAGIGIIFSGVLNRKGSNHKSGDPTVGGGQLS
jgi:uncharacterized membrane protein YhaH (DUF805 family)